MFNFKSSFATYIAAQNYPNIAYVHYTSIFYACAYFTRVFCVGAYVNTRTYARICIFVMHSHKFLCVKRFWSNRGMTKRQASKLNLHIVTMSMSFEFSITSQIHRETTVYYNLLDL